MKKTLLISIVLCSFSFLEAQSNNFKIGDTVTNTYQGKIYLGIIQQKTTDSSYNVQWNSGKTTLISNKEISKAPVGNIYMYYNPNYIAESKQDPYIHSYTIKSIEIVITKFTFGGGRLEVSLMSNGKTLFLNLTGTATQSSLIGTGDKLIFLADNDTTVDAISPEIQQSKYVSDGVYTLDFSYSLTLEQLKEFCRYNFKSFRIYTTEGYLEKGIKPDNEFRNLANTFLKEYLKHN